MATGAGAGRRRSVHRLLLEPAVIMTDEAKCGLVLADGEQKPVGGAVRLVAVEAVAAFDRRMNYPFFTEFVVTLLAERGALLHQIEAFTTLEGMRRRRLPMTGKTLAGGDRLVRLGKIVELGVALGGQTGFGACYRRGEQDQTECQEEEWCFHDTGIPGGTTLNDKIAGRNSRLAGMELTGSIWREQEKCLPIELAANIAPLSLLWRIG
jgi:hypothetical protein